MNAARASFFVLTAFSALGTQGKISTQSPFVPPGGAATSAPAENTPIELRGVMATTEGLVFGLYEPSTQKGAWVKLNEGGHPYTVRTYDAARGSVAVDFQGRTETLTLKEAKFDASAPPPQAAAVQGPRPAVAATPADEQKRLESVAQEIRRRRAARAAAGGQPQAQPPPPPAPTPP